MKKHISSSPNELEVDLQQSEPVSETTFWSELSEAFKRGDRVFQEKSFSRSYTISPFQSLHNTVKEDGFDMAALVLRCSSKMSEESFMFWDLFFSDNFGPAVWAKTAIVLTFAEDIFANRTPSQCFHFDSIDCRLSLLSSGEAI